MPPGEDDPHEPRRIGPVTAIEAIREHLIAAGLDPRAAVSAAEHADDHHWLRDFRARREQRASWGGKLIGGIVLAALTWALTVFGPLIGRGWFGPPR
jgi:hypothetical protein